MSAEYWVSQYHNWTREQQVSWSLPNADVWHFCGHGGVTGWGTPYLVVGGDEDECPSCGETSSRLFGSDIPQLAGTEFEQMRFAFANACYSGRYGVFSPSLIKKFVAQGAEAYMGWTTPIGDEDARDFAVVFYGYAVDQGLSAGDAMNEAYEDVTPKYPDDWGNLLDAEIRYRGDPNVSLIP